HRCVGNDRALDDAFGFQLLKPVAEHPVRDVGDGLPQYGKAAACFEQYVNDRPGPPAADELARAVKFAAELGNLVHGCLHSLFQSTAPGPRMTSYYLTYSDYIFYSMCGLRMVLGRLIMD